MCDREATTTRGCHLGYTDTLILSLLLNYISSGTCQFFMYIIFLHLTDILGQMPTLLNVIFPSLRVTCKSAQQILQTVLLFVPETQIIVNRGEW